jgi:hypothetical protein
MWRRDCSMLRRGGLIGRWFNVEERWLNFEERWLNREVVQCGGEVAQW